MTDFRDQADLNELFSAEVPSKSVIAFFYISSKSAYNSKFKCKVKF